MGEQLFTLEQKDIDQLSTVVEVKAALADVANDPRLTKRKKLNLQAQVIEKLKVIAKEEAAKKAKQAEIPDELSDQKKKRNESVEVELARPRLGEIMQEKLLELEGRKYLKPLTKDNYEAHLEAKIIDDKIKTIDVLKDIDKITDWFVNETTEWGEQRSSKGSGAMLADKINEICRYLIQRCGLALKEDHEVAKPGGENRYGEYRNISYRKDSQRTGEVIFLGEKVPYSWGYGYRLIITDHTGFVKGIKKFIKGYMSNKV